MPRLRRVDCSSAGIRRIGRGLGFSYEEADGTTIVDREVVGRIRELAIPPAWKDVWICPHPNGHIQATGVDQAGRKQYLYHPQWRTDRDRDKFVDMERFARSLPRMRERTATDLARRGMVRDRVLACAIRLLDLGFFRIGSERYTEENETYGLATLRRKHVTIAGGVASFHYKAKGAKDHHQEIADPVLVPDAPQAQGPRRRRLRAARLPRGPQRVGGRQGGRDQRVPQGRHRRRLQRQGLPHLERDRARGRRPGGQRLRGDRRERPQAGGSGGHQARRRVPLEHPGRLPQGLHRPARLRPLRQRRDDPLARCAGWSPAPIPASSSTASASSAPCCG